MSRRCSGPESCARSPPSTLAPRSKSTATIFYPWRGAKRSLPKSLEVSAREFSGTDFQLLRSPKWPDQHQYPLQVAARRRVTTSRLWRSSMAPIATMQPSSLDQTSLSMPFWTLAIRPTVRVQAFPSIRTRLFYKSRCRKSSPHAATHRATTILLVWTPCHFVKILVS